MPILSRHVALVSQTQRVTLNELVIVAAALQKQATRDLGPIWEVNANVSAFATPHDVPSDYWTIFIRDTIPYPVAGGIHLNRNDHQPYALVAYSNDWSRTTSHELCEMVVDPFGNRLVAGG